MNLTALFCNHAETGADGRLTIHGVYNELYAPDFPARQDRIVLVGILEWDRTVSGRQPFRFDLKGPDGSVVITVDGHTEVRIASENQPPAKTHFVFPLENLVFTEPGEYFTYVEIGGKTWQGPSLYVAKAPPEQDAANANTGKDQTTKQASG